ncbi:MAG: amylo-alpha-1,6-glucosidase, partial [Deltaproteobacteria bacterium]
SKAKWLAGLGVKGLRIDVAHNFGTMLPVEPSLSGKPRLFGQITSWERKDSGEFAGGFKTVNEWDNSTANPFLLRFTSALSAIDPEFVLIGENYGRYEQIIQSGVIPMNSGTPEELKKIMPPEDWKKPVSLPDAIGGLIEHFRYLLSGLPDGAQVVTALETHDYFRLMDRWQNIGPVRIKAALWSWIATSRGALMVYNGQTDGEVHRIRVDNRTGRNVREAERQRAAACDEFARLNGISIEDFYSDLLSFYRSHTCLSAKDYIIETSSPAVFAILRYNGQQAVVFAINYSGFNEKVTLNLEPALEAAGIEDSRFSMYRLRFVRTGSERRISGEALLSQDFTVTVPPFDAWVMEISRTDGGLAAGWVAENVPELNGKLLVTLSMEGNIPEFEGYSTFYYDRQAKADRAIANAAQNANTKGGLGAYFGDKLEGLALVGMKAFGVQPMYSKIKWNGEFIDVDYSELLNKGIIKPVLGTDGKPLVLPVYAWDDIDPANPYNNPRRFVTVYRITRGGTSDFLLWCPEVFDVLYTDNKVHRYTQETVYGKAVYQLLKRQGIVPDILHLNEAHTVVAAAQISADRMFEKTAYVYTNHTVVPAGLEMFPSNVLRTDEDRMMYQLGLPESSHRDYRSRFLRPNGVVDFCFGAINLPDVVINAVSEEHAVETVKLFKRLYGDCFTSPVIGVLNGSGQTWKSEQLKQAEAGTLLKDASLLEDIHGKGKEAAFDEIFRRTGIRLDLNKPTAWAVRRIVDYKSQFPMLRYCIHLMTADRTQSFTRDSLDAAWRRDIRGIDMETGKYVLDRLFNGRSTINGLGMQVVVGGPEYEEFWVKEFKRWSGEVEAFKGRFVYVPNSDAQMLKFQAIGADICINMPRPLEEACGTSDQRTGLNAGVNIAIRGAGPVEWVVDADEHPAEGNGYLIGSYTVHGIFGPEAQLMDFYRQAPADIFFRAEHASAMYYGRRADWKQLMFRSYIAANTRVTSKAMEQRYAVSVYPQALKQRSGSLKLHQVEENGSRMICEMVVRDHYDRSTGTSGLRNARKELPSLARSGVDFVYLMGVMEHNGKPFEVIDPRNIDPRAGTFEDLEEFIREAGSLGIRVIIDWLANQHVAKTSPLVAAHPERFLYTNVSDGNYIKGEGSVIIRGRDLDTAELRRRVARGQELVSALRKTAVLPEGTLMVEGRSVAYRRADTGLRSRISGIEPDHTPVIVPAQEARFIVSATDQVALDSFPRRWSALAQPDLSSPEVIAYAVETARFWMGKGFEGIRVDAALSTMPSRIKDNWGFDVATNLSHLCIKEVRKVNADCFVLFEGFEKQDELLRLADFVQAACYDWKARDLITNALNYPRSESSYNDTVAELKYARVLPFDSRPDNLAVFIAFISQLEWMPSYLRNRMVLLFAEHDAYDFRDPWSRLGPEAMRLKELIYSFLPGYMLIFNGQQYGLKHLYSNVPSRTAPVPAADVSDQKEREAVAAMLGLRKSMPELVRGEFRVLRTDDPEVFCLARFDGKTIILAPVNLTQDSKETTVRLNTIFEQCGGIFENTGAFAFQELALSSEGLTCGEEIRSLNELKTSGLRVCLPARTAKVFKLCAVGKNDVILRKLNDARKAFIYDDPVFGKTVVAGIPHFDPRSGAYLYNWGRDAMISASGLLIECGERETFAQVLVNYMRYIRNGVLPNLVGDGSWPRFNSADATLWMFRAVGQALRYGDYGLLDREVERVFPNNGTVKVTVMELLEECLHAYTGGTRVTDEWMENGVKKSRVIELKVDQIDFLLFCGTPDTQLTWMDAQPSGASPVTSRYGKPVEINALRWTMFKVMEDIYRHKGKDDRAAECAALARRVKNNFNAGFWNESAGCLFDVIDGDHAAAGQVRPNQLFAVSEGLLEGERAAKVLEKARNELLTPCGLRTLSPLTAGVYKARHADERSYHQGTVWPWLMGAFIEACVKVYGKERTIKILNESGYFDNLVKALDAARSVPEIYDGESAQGDKYNERGCAAQAWSVGEAIRGMKMLYTDGGMGRRQFIKGTAGLLFGIPAAIELLSGEANAASPDPAMILEWLKKNRAATGMPLSFQVPQDQRKEVYSTMGDAQSVDGVIERIIVAEGLDIYDGAVWQMALTSAGETDLASFPVSVYNLGSLSGFNVRGGSAFVYDPDSASHLMSDKGYIFKLISAAAKYLTEDPLDGKTSLAGYPNGSRIHWEEWKPISGENAWVAMGALQLFHKKHYNSVTNSYDAFADLSSAPEIKLAMDLARYAMVLQAGNGGIRMAPVGTWHAQGTDFYYNEISTENNISWYAAFRMLYSLTRKQEYKDAMNGIERYLKSVESDGLFLQGSHCYGGTWRNNEVFASDCQTWAVCCLGPKTIDSWFGAGTAIAMWGKTKDAAGYYSNGELAGIGFTEGHDQLSVEWTCGAILAARLLGANGDSESMLRGIESLRTDTSAGSGYSYSLKRQWIPFGWYSHDPRVLSTASTGWAYLLARQFNPFILGGAMTEQSLPAVPSPTPTPTPGSKTPGFDALEAAGVLAVSGYAASRISKEFKEKKQDEETNTTDTRAPPEKDGGLLDDLKMYFSTYFLEDASEWGRFLVKKAGQVVLGLVCIYLVLVGFVGGGLSLIKLDILAALFYIVGCSVGAYLCYVGMALLDEPNWPQLPPDGGKETVYLWPYITLAFGIFCSSLFVAVFAPALVLLAYAVAGLCGLAAAAVLVPYLVVLKNA